MKNDPIYLSQALTCEASLGVLSVAGNFCKNIISDVSKNVNGSLLKLAFVLELTHHVCCEEEERFESIDKVLNDKEGKE